jgi:hypothetical protein
LTGSKELGCLIIDLNVDSRARRSLPVHVIVPIDAEASPSVGITVPPGVGITVPVISWLLASDFVTGTVPVPIVVSGFILLTFLLGPVSPVLGIRRHVA